MRRAASRKWTALISSSGIRNPSNPAAPAPFVLDSADLPSVNRALVVVRGWHTESFGPALLESSPEMFRFVEPAVFQQAARAFSPDLAPLKILIVPSLPQTAAARGQSIAILRAKGVDAVIPFRTMLADLIARAEVNRNYDKSDLLQVIRVLKNYQLFKDPQWNCSDVRAAARARPAPDAGSPAGSRNLLAMAKMK